MIKQLPKQTVYGRTKSASNANPAPIGELWQEFSELGLAGECFGIYTNYESDFTGEYDFILATPQQFPDTTEIIVPAGTYQVFDVANGQSGVLKMWQDIWKMELNRAYTSDFEHYQADGQVKIYIALKEDSSHLNN